MAELTLTGTFSFSKGGTNISIDTTPTGSITVTGTNAIHHRQIIGTSEEAILFGDVTVGGWYMMVNRDATNFVQIRAAAAETPFHKLKPGEWAIGRFDATAVPTAQADTADVELEVAIVDD